MLVVVANQTIQFAVVGHIFDERQLDHLHVAEVVKIAIRIPYVSNASAHAGGKVTPCRAEHYSTSSGHVFAAMIAYAFHYGDCARVAHTESFAYTSVDVYFA